MFRRLLLESLAIAILALLIAAPLVELTLGLFSNVLAVHLDWSEVLHPSVLAFVLGLTLFLGTVSGAYPAWLMASQKPALVLKGEFSWGQGVHRIRNALVLMQFAVSIALIAVSLVIYAQIGYSISAPLASWPTATRARSDTGRGWRNALCSMPSGSPRATRSCSATRSRPVMSAR